MSMDGGLSDQSRAAGKPRIGGLNCACFAKATDLEDRSISNARSGKILLSINYCASNFSLRND